MASSERKREHKAGDIVELKASDVITLDQFYLFWERLCGESILHSVLNQALVLHVRESIRKYLSDIDNYPALLKQKLAYQLNLLAKETAFIASETFLLNLSSDIKAGGIILKKMITRETGENKSLIQTLDKKYRERLQSQQPDGSKGFDIKLKSGSRFNLFDDLKPSSEKNFLSMQETNERNNCRLIKEKLFIEAMTQFKKKDYDLSEVLFKRVLQYISTEPGYKIQYAGICLCLFKIYLEKKDYDNANKYSDMAKGCLVDLKKKGRQYEYSEQVDIYLQILASDKSKQGLKLHVEEKDIEAKSCFMDSFDCTSLLLSDKDISSLSNVEFKHFCVLLQRTAITEMNLSNLVTASAYLIRSLQLLERRMLLSTVSLDVFKQDMINCIYLLKTVGFFYSNKNAYQNAETEFRECIEWHKKLLDKDAAYYDILVDSQCHLAETLLQQNKLLELNELIGEIPRYVELYLALKLTPDQEEARKSMKIKVDKLFTKIKESQEPFSKTNNPSSSSSDVKDSTHNRKPSGP